MFDARRQQELTALEDKQFVKKVEVLSSSAIFEKWHLLAMNSFSLTMNDILDNFHLNLLQNTFVIFKRTFKVRDT